MSAIQIVCAVAVPLLWGYHFVAIKAGVMEFPLSSFSHCASWPSRCCYPFVRKPTRRQFGTIAAISIFLGG
jgi:O-acetylserine/cysteine efflux transporter